LRFSFSKVDGFAAGSLPATLANVSPLPPDWNLVQATGLGNQDPLSPSNDSRPPRLSAVAFLFLPPQVSGAPAEVLLIRRGAHYGSHRGQMGLAGGRAESTDVGPIDTLIRELHEELGIPGEVLNFHGHLAVRRAIDGSVVLPCVVTARWSPRDIKAAPDEVASVSLAPWTSLTNAMRSSFAFTMFGVRRESILYRVDGATVWGLTASIINTADMLPPDE
jgi:8-oxo-dGTP pyrophosphatase MutT (NUDIX family)